MITANKFLSVVIIISFIAVSYFSLSPKEIVFPYAPAGEFVASTLENKNTTQTYNQSYFKSSKELVINEFETPNGLVMQRGEIHNQNNITQSYNVLIRFGLKEFYLTINVLPNRTWTYATLDDILILPSPSDGDAIIDPLKTSYYPLGDELLLGFIGNVSKMKIYFRKDKMPSVIYTHTDNKWRYDPQTKMLLIESDDGYFDSIVLYFSKFLPHGTIVMEDTRNIENLRHIISKTEHLLPMLKQKLNDLNITFNDIGLDIKEIQNQTNKVITEKKELENNLELEQVKEQELEEKISGKVVAPPFVFVFAIIGIIILLIIILDLAVLSKNVKKR